MCAHTPLLFPVVAGGFAIGRSPSCSPCCSLCALGRGGKGSWGRNTAGEERSGQKGRGGGGWRREQRVPGAVERRGQRAERCAHRLCSPPPVFQCAREIWEHVLFPYFSPLFCHFLKGRIKEKRWGERKAKVKFKDAGGNFDPFPHIPFPA